MTTNTPADEMLRLLQEKEKRIATLEQELQQARQEISAIRSAAARQPLKTEGLKRALQYNRDGSVSCARHGVHVVNGTLPHDQCQACDLESKLQEALQRIAELEAELQTAIEAVTYWKAETQQARHSFNTLQHDYTEQQRINNEEMNRLSEHWESKLQEAEAVLREIKAWSTCFCDYHLSQHTDYPQKNHTAFCIRAEKALASISARGGK